MSAAPGAAPAECSALRGLKQLGEGLRQLREEGVGVDVEFQVEGRRFAAHRLVLKAACEYFHRMLSSSFSEASPSAQPIPIADMSAEAFHAVLEFIYGSVEAISVDNVCQALQAADRICFDVMAECCIELLLERHLTACNCCEALRVASSAAGMGRLAPWRRLVTGCATFAAAHLVDVLVCGEATGRCAFEGLDARCVAAVVEAAGPGLAGRTELLLRLWRSVAAWAERKYDLKANETCSFMADWNFAALDFLDSAGGGFDVPTPKVADGKSTWESSEFLCGGFQWSVAVTRNADWYGVSVRPCSRCAWPHPWACFAAWRFVLSVPSGPDLERSVSTDIYSREEFAGRKLWNIMSQAFPQSDVDQHLMASGSSARFRADVRVNPLLGLCAAAAVLDFQSRPQQVLGSFSSYELQDILSSDLLDIESEEQLWAAVVVFLSSPNQNMQKGNHLLKAVRLQHVPLCSILDAAKECEALQRSETFEKLLRSALSSATRIASIFSDRSSVLKVRGRRASQGAQDPAAVHDFDSLVRWCLQPSARSKELEQLLEQALEEQCRLRQQLEDLQAPAECGGCKPHVAGEGPAGSASASAEPDVAPQAGQASDSSKDEAGTGEAPAATSATSAAK